MLQAEGLSATQPWFLSAFAETLLKGDSTQEHQNCKQAKYRSQDFLLQEKRNKKIGTIIVETMSR